MCESKTLLTLWFLLQLLSLPLNCIMQTTVETMTKTHCRNSECSAKVPGAAINDSRFSARNDTFHCTSSRFGPLHVTSTGHWRAKARLSVRKTRQYENATWGYNRRKFQLWRELGCFTLHVPAEASGSSTPAHQMVAKCPNLNFSHTQHQGHTCTRWKSNQRRTSRDTAGPLPSSILIRSVDCWDVCLVHYFNVNYFLLLFYYLL